MRTIASLILPVSSPTGAALENLHACVAMDLRDVFGRVTPVQSVEQWRDEETGLTHRETVVAYVVASDDWTPRLIDILDRIAGHAACKSGHDRVRVDHADGSQVFNVSAAPRSPFADLDDDAQAA